MMTPTVRGTFELEIEVFCPVEALFTPTNLNPFTGENVNFENFSNNADNYEWSINGTFISNTIDFSTDFSNPGGYQVCLEADNGLCDASYCQFIFVEAPGLACDTSSEVILLGTQGVDEDIFKLGTLSNGNAILGGSYNNEAFLAEVSPDFQVLWTQRFNFSIADEFITEIYEDNEGNLICSAYSDLIVGNYRDVYIFKYDPTAQNIIWAKEFFVEPDENRSIFNKIIDPPAGQSQDQYWVFGQTWPTINGFNCDATFMKIDRNTGDQEGILNYNLGSCETFRDIQFVDGDIYLTGRYNNANGGSNQMRAAVSKMSYDGDVDWSKLYLVQSPGANARCYPKRILHRNDYLHIWGNGDLNGTSTSDVELFLFQTDMDGNLQFAQIYDFLDGNDEEAFQMFELSDGFLLSGDFDANGNREAFVMKVDFAGDLQWAKAIGTVDSEFSRTLSLVDDKIWIAGISGDLNGNDDIFIVKLDLQGNILSGDCDFAYDLNVNNFLLTNPYEGFVTLDPHVPNDILNNISISTNSATLPVNQLCPSDCEEICDNGIDDDDDGLIDCFDEECACNEVCETFFIADCPEDCIVDPFPGDFSIEELWESEATVCNWALPVVGDIDADGTPEVISFRSDGPGYAFDGLTGLIKYTYSQPGLTTGSAYTSIGNIDDDPEGEVIVWQENEIIVFEHDGNIKWAVPNPMPSQVRISGIYDFNEDGIPEISFGTYIFSSIDGTLLVEGTGASGTNPNYSPVGLVVGIDILSQDDCGTPICQGLELVAGPNVYAVTIVSYSNPALNSISLVREIQGYGDGYTSVADLDEDGDLDIIVAGNDLNNFSSGVYVWDPLTEQLSLPYWTLGSTTLAIGRPSIADFDNDGALEIAVHAADFNGGDLQVIDDDMTTLWSINTNDVSGATGCTAFDFNGDGAAEIVYRDQSQLRIIEGSTGTTITSFSCSSGTINEYPVVADINGDGQTEITCNCGGTPSNVNVARTTVWGSADSPWMPSRPVWNQHAYFNTNVFDDLSIPQEQQQPHLPGENALNSFITQYSNPEFPVPDATVDVLDASCNGDSLIILAQVCNIGEQILSFSTPISIWEEDPTVSPGATLVTNNFTLGQNLSPDSCLNLTLNIASSGPVFSIIVNDNGSLAPVFDLDNDFPITSIAECDYSNNIFNFDFLNIPPPLDLGPDIQSCATIVNFLDAGPGFVAYEWQDGSIEQTFTAFEPGTYWVNAIDSCGNMQTDTIIISIDPATTIDLGPDQIYCQDTPISITVSGFDDYLWTPNIFIDCDTCSTILITPDSTVCYTLMATTAEGCQAIDSIKIFAGMPVSTFDTTFLCEGDTITLFGDEISEAGNYSDLFTSSIGCDSTHTITVIELDTTITLENRVICENETTDIFGVPTNVPGDYPGVFVGANGCDSTHIIQLEVLDTFQTQEVILICPGDSALIFGVFESNPGIYASTFTGQNNCDSTHSISLLFHSPLQINMTANPVCEANSLGQVEAMVTGGNGPFSYEWNVSGVAGPILEEVLPGEYTVTVTDANGCTISASTSVEEYLAPDLDFLITPVICFGDENGSIEILNSTSGYSFSLDGTTFSTSTLFEQLAAGNYNLIAQDPNGCLFEYDLYVGTPPELLLILPDTLQIVLGESIEINGQSNTLNILNYQWEPLTDLSCLDCLDPVASPVQATLYTLSITDENGCIAIDETLIEVIPNYEVYIPNAFSPDEDGINDGFTLYANTNVAAIQELLIFDRWGELIFKNTNFQPNDPTAGWDGRFRGERMNAGIFVYMAKVAFIDNHVELFKGDVLLLR